MGFTSPRTWSAEKLLSAVLNIHVRDNLNYLKDNVGLGTPTELTIDTGVVTKTKAYHTIDTEGDGSPDDLDTINGGTEGDIIIVRAEHTDRTVIVKNATGNIILAADVTLDDTNKHLMLIYDGTNWQHFE